MKIHEIIEKLKDFHPENNNPNTTDVIKYGCADVECTGVIVTCSANAKVISRARELGANFVITHEPLFFNHADETAWLDGDPVFEAKRSLLDEGGITVWRDHDSIHGGPPMKEGKPHMDGIFYGIMSELGWKNYLVKYKNMPLIFEIPETTGRELANLMIDKLGLNGLRYVGDLDTKVKRVFFCEHINGQRGRPNAEMPPDNEIMRIVREECIDALIPLEIVDWTLSAYINDCAYMGQGKVILEMGHFNVEELGMRCMARWLPDVIGSGVPVHYVQSGDSFGYLMN